MSKKVVEGCVFCKIASGEIPSKTVYEDDDFRAILDISPASKGHVIILPKNHADNIFEISDEDASGIMLVAKKIASKVKNVFGCDGVNILQNNGEAAGQTVFHLHVHVIPRYENDNIRIKWTQHEDIDIDSVYNELSK
mgnify:FL=1